MPEIGEIRRAKELGFSGKGKFIFSACSSCGKQRWVELAHGLPRSPRCRSCAPKENITKIISKCAECGKQISIYPSAIKRGGGKFCSRECYHKHNFVGRYKIQGYIKIWLSPDDFFYPMANQRDKYGGYVLEHRLVMAKHLERCLLPWEVVHHKNGIRDDNRIENLKLLPTVKYHLVDSITKSYITKLERRIASLEAEKELLIPQ